VADEWNRAVPTGAFRRYNRNMVFVRLMRI